MKKTIFVIFAVFGLLVIFSGSALAAKARLTWNANVESDLSGYKVYWGTVPRAQSGDTYANSQDVGYVTTYEVDNIADTGTTYFAVTALDDSENESEFSTEGRKTPGDIGRNGTVNMLDFQSLVTNYGNSTCDNEADINLDCVVNMLDFSALVTNYGATAS